MSDKPRLKQLYDAQLREELQQKFSYTNRMEVPRLEKIVINMGVGEASQDSKKIQAAVEEMALIAGQKPVGTVAKKSIAGFRVREEMPLGAKVTLRGDRMYEFMDRLVSVALPRTRDFKGISGKAFDGRGNYTLGLKEQTIFQEIEYDKIDKIKGMNVCFVTSAKTDEEGKALLKRLGMPFKN